MLKQSGDKSFRDASMPETVQRKGTRRCAQSESHGNYSISKTGESEGWDDKFSAYLSALFTARDYHGQHTINSYPDWLLRRLYPQEILNHSSSVLCSVCSEAPNCQNGLECWGSSRTGFHPGLSYCQQDRGPFLVSTLCRPSMDSPLGFATREI